MKFFFLLLFSTLISSLIVAQSVYTENDIEICISKFDLAVDKNLSEFPINEIVLEIADSFSGVEYEEKTLDQYDKEQLVVHLTGFDCYTLLETSLVFARSIKSGKASFKEFQNELTNIRYRNGVINKYPSRLHYFSDWIFDADKRGIVKDVTKEIGGTEYDNDVYFMSRNATKYRQLANNPDFVEELKLIEEDINSREYYYIPQEKIFCVEDKILPGDLIGITTNIDGLDISHTGIAVKLDDGRIHMLHAPNIGKKIQITDSSLAEYLISNSKQTGIMIARPLEP